MPMDLVKQRLPEHKVVFVGDTAVGKTSIIMRFHQNMFMENTSGTIGSAFISKEIETKKGLVCMNIWDTAGQERYRSLVPMYARGAAVVILVFDVSDRESFEQLGEWTRVVKEEVPSAKMILCGNKCDLRAQVPKEEVLSWAEAYEMKTVFVSAKTSQRIKELFDLAGELLPVVPRDSMDRRDYLPEETKKQCC